MPVAPNSISMVKTGSSILETLSLVAMLLSLGPVLIILFRRAWQSDLLNFLMVLSLLTFFQHLLTGTSQLAPSGRSFIQAVFSLGEFMILLYLFRPTTRQKWVRDLFNLFAIAFLSVVITIYAIKGPAASYGTIGALESVILLLAAVMTLLRLLKADQVFIFQLPMFWIIVGTLCYSSMYLLLELLQHDNGNIPADQQQEKLILLAVLNSIRSVLFMVAAYLGSAQLRPENR